MQTFVEERSGTPRLLPSQQHAQTALSYAAVLPHEVTILRQLPNRTPVGSGEQLRE